MENNTTNENTTNDTLPITNGTENPNKNINNREITQFWENINYIRKNENGKWQCAEKECKQTYQATPPLLRHIAKKRPTKHMPPNEETKCPRCGKTYNAISSLLKHLKIRTQNATWPIRIFPIKKQESNIQETWEEILKYNKKLTTKEQTEYTQNQIRSQQQQQKTT